MFAVERSVGLHPAPDMLSGIFYTGFGEGLLLKTTLAANCLACCFYSRPLVEPAGVTLQKATLEFTQGQFRVAMIYEEFKPQLIGFFHVQKEVQYKSAIYCPAARGRRWDDENV